MTMILQPDHNMWLALLHAVFQVCSAMHLSLCKEWLTSPCHPLLVNPSKPVPICGAVVQPGHVVAHASHVLWMFRGLFFCNRCGMYGSTKFKLLGVQCKLPTTHGKRALKAIRDCKLPSGLACRPVLNVHPRRCLRKS